MVDVERDGLRFGIQFDVEKLRAERRVNTTFINAQRHSHAHEIVCKPVAPKEFEWYGAFGLMVTIVWLYVEILRLLAKLNRR